MNLNNLTDYGWSWLVMLAGAGLVIMSVLVLLILVNKLPGVGQFIRHALLRIPTLNGRLSMGFFIVSVVPALVLPPLLAMMAVNAMQSDRITQLSGSAQTISGVLNPLIDKLSFGVATLADNITAIKQLDKPALDGWLLRYHRQHPEFVSTWIAKPDGGVVAATAAEKGQVSPWEGPKAGVALMESFAPAVASNGLFVSSVQKGVAPRFDPMMVFSAPILGESGQTWGVVQAQLNLRELFAGFIEQDPESNFNTLIVDEKNQVLVSSAGIGFSPFENISGHPLIVQASRPDRATSYSFEGTLQQSGEAENFAVAKRSLGNGWRVFVIASQAGIEKQGLAYFGLLAIWAVVALLLARSLSGIHSNNVAESLKQLEESLYIFDAERTISLIPSAPKYAPREVQQVHNRVRESMRKSLDAYRDLRRAVTEGEEQRREVNGAVTERRKRRLAKEKTAETRKGDDAAAPAPGYAGRIDSVTQLSGLEVFEEFFGEAWVMGGAESRPLSLVQVSVNRDRISQYGQDDVIEDSVISSVATAIRGNITRTLDLVARIDAYRFAIVLPDTNLEGALTVAKKVQLSVQSAAGEDYLANAGAVTIVPKPDGNARSFINLAQRALQAAEQRGGKVTFFNSEGKIMLLEEQEAPDSPEDALTIRSGTVSAKNIEESLGDEAAPAAVGGKPKPSAQVEEKPENDENSAFSEGTHVLEWDGEI